MNNINTFFAIKTFRYLGINVKCFLNIEISKYHKNKAVRYEDKTVPRATPKISRFKYLTKYILKIIFKIEKSVTKKLEIFVFVFL